MALTSGKFPTARTITPEKSGNRSVQRREIQGNGEADAVMVHNSLTD
jgi:hypothetical protein